MTGGYSRAIGGLLLLACWWWVIGALKDVSVVSPVHWGLLLPHLALFGFPAVMATFTAAAMLLGRSGVRALFLGLAIAAAQAAAVSLVAPEIEQRYSKTIEQSKENRSTSALQ
jgi:hypothetical protein